MAAAIRELTSNRTARALDLTHPTTYNNPEVSGTGLITYALATESTRDCSTARPNLPVVMSRGWNGYDEMCHQRRAWLAAFKRPEVPLLPQQPLNPRLRGRLLPPRCQRDLQHGEVATSSRRQKPSRSGGDGARVVSYPAVERVNLRVASLFVLERTVLRGLLRSPAGRITAP